MKTKLYIVFILIMFAGLPFEAQAVEHDFAAGSIIIPMDQFYQPGDAVPGSGLQDGGILEAYGLAYYPRLLWQTVHFFLSRPEEYARSKARMTLPCTG